jgi:uncharacterized protein (TIGR03437 family)
MRRILLVAAIVALLPDASIHSPHLTWDREVHSALWKGLRVTRPSPLLYSLSAATTITLSVSSLNDVVYTLGDPAPPSQFLQVQSLEGEQFAFTAGSNTTWLGVTPTSGIAPTVLTVSFAPTSLSPGKYNGQVFVSASGALNSPQYVNVSLTVKPRLLTTPFTISAGSLGFSFEVGGNPPSSQMLSISTGSVATPFTVTVAQGTGTWLSISTSIATTPATIFLSVDPDGLGVGAYHSSLTIASMDGSNSSSVPVTLTITGPPTVSVSPVALSFQYQIGGGVPANQALSVAGSTPGSQFSAVAASEGSWLFVSPVAGSTGATPVSLSVSVNPAGLNPGAYSGTITVTGTNGTLGTSIINVTLTVTALLPTISAVTNAASYANGAVSPGELVTIFGTNIGPATAASATTDPATGKLATTIGGVQVLFNGIAAPMIYASSTQVSAVVPYEMAPVASPGVWIKYAGQTSNAYQLTSTTTAPGLFTQNASRSGPGAILNQDNSVNGPGNPAAEGSIVQVYLTGEGQTSPPGVTGAITTATLPPPQVTPAPLLSIGVLINGQPALYVYAGEAPGLVTGMMQLNVQIPANAPSGDLQILVSIGGNTSQNGVTVSVR